MTKSKQEWDTKKPPEDGSLVGVREVQTDYTSFYLPGNGHGLRLLMTDGTSRVMTPEDIKHIIGEDRQRVVEMIEGMKQSSNDYVGAGAKEIAAIRNTYNSALSDIQSKLKEEL